VSLESRAASTSEPIGYWALLRENARYRRLWTGLVVSMAGDWFRTIALYHLVLHLTGASGLALSGVVLAQTLSLFLLSPVAGVGGGLLILFALFAEQLFQAGAMGMSTLYMTRGLGAMLGPLLARRFVGEAPETMGRAISVAFFISASFHLAFAYMPTLWLAAAALFLATMAANVLWVFSSTLLQLSVPDTYRGRVFATDFALFTIVMSVSTFITGWSLDHSIATPRTLAAILGGLLFLPGLLWLPTTLRQQPAFSSSSAAPGDTQTGPTPS
jgi:MFS family permease